MALSGIAAGADGIMIEVHPNPKKALVDPLQPIDYRELKNLMILMNKVAKSATVSFLVALESVASIKTKESPFAIAASVNSFKSTDSAVPPPPANPVPATLVASASASTPASLMLIVLAAEPLNVVPLFN